MLNNPSLLELFIVAFLAVYRLTYMLSSESGPADIFGRFRARAGVRFDQYSKPYGTNWFSEGILCFYCLSVWVGFGAAALLALAWLAGYIQVAVIILLPFALSGGAIFLKKWLG